MIAAAEFSRVTGEMFPERVQVRKVRASQGRMPDNVRRRRLPGQCNREQTAASWR